MGDTYRRQMVVMHMCLLALYRLLVPSGRSVVDRPPNTFCGRFLDVYFFPSLESNRIPPRVRSNNQTTAAACRLCTPSPQQMFEGKFRRDCRSFDLAVSVMTDQVGMRRRDAQLQRMPCGARMRTRSWHLVADNRRYAGSPCECRGLARGLWTGGLSYSGEIS